MELNKVLLIGRLTADPELRYLPAGTPVCDLRLASNRTWSDKGSGDRKEEVLFINVTAWSKTAEFCNQYLKKGRQVFIEGRLKRDEWQDNEGKKREKITIVADRVQFADSRPQEGGGGGRGGGGESGYDEGAPAAARSGGGSGGGSGGAGGRDSGGGSDGGQTNDDLPF